jgi:hypothetical protein
MYGMPQTKAKGDYINLRWQENFKACVAKSHWIHSVFKLSATGLYLVMTVTKEEYTTNVVIKREGKFSETIVDLVAELRTEACQVRHSAPAMGF